MNVLEVGLEVINNFCDFSATAHMQTIRCVDRKQWFSDGIIAGYQSVQSTYTGDVTLP